jgi:predicted DNA-binding ribbon-helix-helix protein
MLVNRNITVGELRTSVRLEPEFWSALSDISEREKVTIDQLCTLIDAHLGELGRTAAIRVFIASYFAAKQADKLDMQQQRPFAHPSQYRVSAQPQVRATG